VASAKTAISNTDHITDVTHDQVAMINKSKLVTNVNFGTLYIDSLAIDHMCYDRTKFSNLMRFADLRRVTLENNSWIEAFRSRDIPLTTN
jgi:hypothetical protein